MNLSFKLDPNRYFDPDPTQRRIAGELYESVASLPLICPHGHVDPVLFADPDYTFRSPTEFFLIPQTLVCDHYIFRMLYSQGIPLETLGIPTVDGSPSEGVGYNNDMRKIWQIFAENFHLFRGTPTGVWLTEELEMLFGIEEKLDGENAQAIYSQIEAQLALPEFQPRRLFERFNIEVLCTTDPAWDALAQHQAIRDSGWSGRVLPTFRPDGVINLGDNWQGNLISLEEAVGREIGSYASFIQALEERRAYFIAHGAKATDHAALSAATFRLSELEADSIFQRALQGQVTPEDAARFTAHMFMEMARMSCEDGLVMQLHVGASRDHNPAIFQRFGRDRGADIPIQGEFTRALQPLLAEFGSLLRQPSADHKRQPKLTLIVFTLDEATYARELAPLAGHYPALKLGPPWWFHDSLNGMQRYLDQVVETAGLYNLAGFNDDTRAFPSIPARHEVWRRSACNWAAGLAARHIVDKQDAFEMVRLLAYDLAKIAYHL